jgi:hypothetical protein
VATAGAQSLPNQRRAIRGERAAGKHSALELLSQFLPAPMHYGANAFCDS